MPTNAVSAKWNASKMFMERSLLSVIDRNLI